MYLMTLWFHPNQQYLNYLRRQLTPVIAPYIGQKILQSGVVSLPALFHKYPSNWDLEVVRRLSGLSISFNPSAGAAALSWASVLKRIVQVEHVRLTTLKLLPECE